MHTLNPLTLTSPNWKTIALVAGVTLLAVSWFIFGIGAMEVTRWRGEAAIPSEATVPAKAVAFVENDVDVVKAEPAAESKGPSR